MRYTRETFTNQMYMCPPHTPPIGIGRGLFNYYVGTSSPRPCEESSVIFYMCPPPSGRDETCPYMSPRPCEKSSVAIYMFASLTGNDEGCSDESLQPIDLLNHNRGDDVLYWDVLDSNPRGQSRENGNPEAILKVTCRDLCPRSGESVPFYTEKSSRYA